MRAAVEWADEAGGQAEEAGSGERLGRAGKAGSRKPLVARILGHLWPCGYRWPEAEREGRTMADHPPFPPGQRSLVVVRGQSGQCGLLDLGEKAWA